MAVADEDSNLKPNRGGAGLELARAHLGVLAGVGIAAIVVVRLLLFAEWNLVTAAAILQYTGSTNVVIGASLASASPLLFLIVVSPGAVVFYRRVKYQQWPGKSFGAYIVGASAVICIFLTPVYVAIYVPLFWAFAALLGRMERRLEPKRQRIASLLSSPHGRFLEHGPTNAAFIGGGLLFTALVMTLTTSSSWLPSESISVNGKPAFTGYILADGESDEWVVLRDDPRQVEFISSVTNRDRALCDLRSYGWLDRPLIALLGSFSKVDYPDCP